MKRLVTWGFYLVLAVITPAVIFADQISWKASGRNGVVAAGHADSVAAGVGVLDEGGRAGDAAAATILAMAVLLGVASFGFLQLLQPFPHCSEFGGSCGRPQPAAVKSTHHGLQVKLRPFWIASNCPRTKQLL